jgi:hypothetical protein
VSDKPDHAFLVMAMYGKFNLLTDGWEPELISRIDGTNFDVVYITLNSRNELIPTKIGTFEIESNMKLSGGVITVDQMKSIPGFKQS